MTDFERNIHLSIFFPMEGRSNRADEVVKSSGNPHRARTETALESAVPTYWVHVPSFELTLLSNVNYLNYRVGEGFIKGAR